MRKIYQCVNFSDGCKPDAVIVSLALVFALALALALAPTFALGLVAIVVVIVSRRLYACHYFCCYLWS
jgi:hypothetical protein